MSIDALSDLPDWTKESVQLFPAKLRSGDPIARKQEEALIRQAQAGSHDAFRELVDWHQDRIYRFCLLRTVSREDAEEICQDTFVRAYDALPRWIPKARFSTWLYSIANNLARDRFRSRSNRNAVRTDSLDSPQNGDPLSCRRPRPDETISREEEVAAVEFAISRLPQKLREAILLHAVEGLSYDECASVLDCSRRAVEGRLYRARRELLSLVRK